MNIRKLIGLLVVCGIGVSGIGTAAAQPAGPPAGYKIDPECGHEFLDPASEQLHACAAKWAPNPKPQMG
jgi:hypothetical protein